MLSLRAAFDATSRLHLRRPAGRLDALPASCAGIVFDRAGNCGCAGAVRVDGDDVAHLPSTEHPAHVVELLLAGPDAAFG